jgi:hypothetical protein
MFQDSYLTYDFQTGSRNANCGSSFIKYSRTLQVRKARARDNPMGGFLVLMK